MIRFLLDMGVSPICGNWLNDRGWDAKHLNEMNLSKLPDNEIILLAQTENRVILTCDNDFGTLMALENIKNPSLILFRLDDFTPININKKLAIILKEIPQSQLLSGLFITVKEKNYRIRKLPMIL